MIFRLFYILNFCFCNSLTCRSQRGSEFSNLTSLGMGPPAVAHDKVIKKYSSPNGHAFYGLRSTVLDRWAEI